MIWVVKHQEVMVDLGQLGFNCGILKGQKTEKNKYKEYLKGTKKLKKTNIKSILKGQKTEKNKYKEYLKGTKN
jgi:hypothetical protein